jgi:hypothetical protein
MAEVLIKYKADAGDLEAIVNKINKVNDDVVKSATESSKRVGDEFKKIGATAVNAFANQQLAGAVKNLNTQVAGLTTGLRLNVDALKKFDSATDNTTDSLKDFDEEVKKTNKILVQSAQDVAKYEDRLRELSVAGQRNTDEFKDIAKAVGEYKSAIIAADRAVDLYAKSTDAATGRIGELEDKLYDLALAGKANTKEFNDLVKEVATVRRAVIETDAQVDALAQRGAKLKGFVQSVELVGVAFQAVEGAAALTGKENEELQKTLVKLQAIMAITSALEQGRVIIMEQLAAKTGIAGLAMKAYTFVTNGAATATKIWRGLLVASGIGAVVAILGTLASKFLDNKEATNEAAEAAKEYQKAIDDLNRTAAQSAVKAGNAQIELLQKQGKITEEQAKRLIVFNELQTGLSDAAVSAKDKETEALKRLEEQKALDIKTFGKVTKATQEQLGKDLLAIETERSNKEKELRAQAEIEIINISNERKEKEKENAKKAAEDLAKARENLANLELDALQASLDERESILNESNNKIAELEKAFIDSKFKKGSDEEIKLQNAIQSIKEDATKQIAAIDQKALEEKIAKEKEAAEKIAEEQRAAAESSINTQINLVKELEIELGSSLERRVELINLEADQRKLSATNSIKDEKERASAIELINAETQQKIRDEQKKTTDQAVNDAFEIADAVANTLGAIVELQGAQSQARIDEINNTATLEQEAINKSLESEADKQRKLDALRLRTSRQIAAEKTKQAKSERALNVFKAVIDTAASITKTGAQLGYPAAIPFQVAAGVIGATQIATILAQPLPKFKKGGIVGGRSHDAGGTIIEAERGEFVVNRNAVTRHRSELDALNTSSAAFKRLIDERYVRPALNYYMGKKERAINVNASLNSKGMEKEIKGMRRDLKRNKTIVNINGNDSRYAWHLN